MEFTLEHHQIRETARNKSAMTIFLTAVQLSSPMAISAILLPCYVMPVRVIGTEINF